MHCCPGTPGQRHDGVRILKMHVNLQYMVQYMLLETTKVREMLTHSTARRCFCGICGAVSGLPEPGNPEWFTWEKSNKGWYTQRCHQRVTSGKQCLL